MYPQELLPRKSKVSPVLDESSMFVRTLREFPYECIEDEEFLPEISDAILAPNGDLEVYSLSLYIYGVYNENHFDIVVTDKDYFAYWNGNEELSDVPFELQKRYAIFLKANSLKDKSVEFVNDKCEKDFYHLPECVLIAIMSCLSAFVGAAAMYAAVKKNRSAASDGSMLSASIDSAMNNVKRIRSEIKQISGSIDGLAAAGGTEKYAGGTTNMEVTVSSLKNNIAFIKEIVSSMGAAASTEPTAESERMGYAHEKADIPTMTVSEMFNKVSELRSIAEPNQFLDYNESEGKTVRSAKNDYRKEADYIFEAVGENKYFIYINRNSFFNAADVSNRLFEVKADGTIRGDVPFRPCVSDNGVFIKGKLG